MASIDMTGRLERLKGTNAETQYSQLDAYIVDGAEANGIMEVDTHTLVSIPAGRALVGVRAVSLQDAASGGSATLQFKAKAGDTAAAALNGSAYAVAGMKKGVVYSIPVQGVAAYGESAPTLLQMTVGGAAFTALKFMLFVETIPLESFLNRG